MKDRERPLDAARGIIYALRIMLPVWFLVCLALIALFGG